MSAPFLIGLSGRKGSGKDYTCKLLHQFGWEDGYHVERIAFADELKDELAAACGVDRQFIEDHKDQFRLGLQWWGTEFRRQLIGGQNYWIEKIEKSLAQVTSSVAVVTDVRFVDEARWVATHGGILVRVSNRKADAVDDTHQSEVVLDDYMFDHQLDNLMDEEYREVVREFWKLVVVPRVIGLSTVAQ